MKSLHSHNNRRTHLSRRAYKVTDVAEILGITPNSIRRLIARGILKPIRVLRHVLIPAEQIEALLKN